MEDKKLDFKSIIGFVLISVVLMWMMYSNAPTQEEQEAKAKQEQVEKAKKEKASETSKVNPTDVTPVNIENDSIQQEQLKGQFGSFDYSAALPSAKDEVTELKSEL